ncbi:MAG TPA: glycoside hydrolase family 16 protein [Cyclobacteriaceae bacterium]
MRYFIIVCCFLFACTSGSRKLVWSDEFEYSGQPHNAFWNYQIGDGCPNLCGWGNNEQQLYTKDSSNVRIENGKLVIEAMKKDSVWTSARLTTKDKMNFTYGRIEFRAKLPTGIGTWPALWMLGEQVDIIGWPACGEMDVLEHVGRNPGVIQSALHSKSSSGDTVNKGDTHVETFDSDFHVYGANWLSDKIEFFVDDKIFYVYQPETFNEETWPFQHPFYVIINIAMGGGLGGPIDPALTRARMEVDYVRVYE